MLLFYSIGLKLTFDNFQFINLDSFWVCVWYIWYARLKRNIKIFRPIVYTQNLYGEQAQAMHT